MDIGAVVRIAKIKDIKTMIYAFAEVKAEVPEARLHIMGDVDDKEYFEEQVQKIIDTREWTKKELRALGFEFPDSQSNFILATHPKVSAKKLFEALKKENIYVRFLGGARIQEYLRISVGTHEEMESLISFLKEYLEK